MITSSTSISTSAPLPLLPHLITTAVRILPSTTTVTKMARTVRLRSCTWFLTGGGKRRNVMLTK
uniref:Uncharacterized protein MANES_09G043300 n=1 Tax=Rhizophora mucronata TaxID=61149 RepID=A0A2P2Q3M2_RHIMU